MSKWILAAAGGLIASEALGITNFSGGGGGGGGESPLDPGVIQALAGAGQSSIRPGMIQALAGAGQSSIDPSLVTALASGQSPTEIVVNETKDRVTEATSGNGNTEETITDIWNRVKETTNSKDSGGNGESESGGTHWGREAGRIGTQTFVTGPIEGGLSELQRFGEETVMGGVDATIDAGTEAGETWIDTHENVGRTVAEGGSKAVDVGAGALDNAVSGWVEQEKENAKELAELAKDTPISGGGSTGARLIQ